jgi:hypothetical protein
LIKKRHKEVLQRNWCLLLQANDIATTLAANVVRPALLPLGFDTIQPVAGPALRVRYREDPELDPEFHEDHRVREARQQGPSAHEILGYIKEARERGR